MNEKQTLTDPRKIARNIKQSNEYLAQGEKPSSMATLRKKIAKVAFKFAGHDSENNFANLEQMSTRLFGSLAHFIDNQMALDDLRVRREQASTMSQRKKLTDDMEPYKRGVIGLNRSISDIFDANRDISNSDIQNFAHQAWMLMHKPEEVQYGITKLKQALRGMDHEMAMEAAFWNIPGVDDVRRATEQDELMGIDRIIEFDDGEILNIDVKSSRRGAEDVIYRPGHGLPLASQFSDDEIFLHRPTDEALAARQPYINQTIADLKKRYGERAA